MSGNTTPAGQDDAWKVTFLAPRDVIHAALLAHEDAYDWDHEIVLAGSEIAEDRPDDWQLEAWLSRKPGRHDLAAMRALFAGNAPRAVVEHLHRSAERGPRTLFATHYQELTQLDKHLPRMRNYSVAVKEWNDEIVFVRRVVEGAADRSYGIQVARLAGLPLSVIDRAKTILAQLESDDVTVSLPSPQARPKKKITVQPDDDSQLSLL